MFHPRRGRGLYVTKDMRINHMFYRMGYINVIEREEIINQFDLYTKLQED